jgi:uncharacterized Rmd1/YagE family protein
MSVRLYKSQDDKETKIDMETDLSMSTYQVSNKRNDLVKDKINLRNRIRNAKKNSNESDSAHLSSLERQLEEVMDQIKAIDQLLALKKKIFLVLKKRSMFIPNCWKRTNQKSTLSCGIEGH